MMHGERRRAFTLIEVLVVVAIIALLIAILIPSLRRVRDQAKETVCATQLSQFGKGFYAYAAANKEYLCSGSFDPDRSNGRDGPPDQVGWVADLVNTKAAFPGETLCPTNAARYNQKLDPGSSSGSSGFTLSKADDLVARKYNTNYTQSWYMARTEMRKSIGNIRSVAATLGPLRVGAMIKVLPARVPLIGDGSIESADTYRGEKTVRTMTDGPYGGPYGIQNYADFGPAHGFGPVGTTSGLAMSERDRAVILMADGHIERFIDRHNEFGKPPRNGRFGINEYDPQYPLGTQEDLELARVFDGVLGLGRRSEDDQSRK